MRSLLGHANLYSSMDFLELLQLRSGMVPWFKGGKADPWNHTEAALALALGGRFESAMRAVDWLLNSQNGDGSWCHFYLSRGVAEPRRDTNTCCYPVLLVSVLDRLLGDRRVMEPYVEMALRGVDLALSYQKEDGSIPWAIDPGGTAYPTSLTAASSSVRDSLKIAAELCQRYSKKGASRYSDASELLGWSITGSAGDYADTSGWAMDHYYPVLGGLGDQGVLSEVFLNRFYVPGWGIRCIADSEWFTAAETAETAMALHIAGQEAPAQDIYSTLERFRQKGGGYLTGIVWPSGAPFPLLEESAYSVAAVVISSYVLAVKAESSLGATILSLVS